MKARISELIADARRRANAPKVNNRQHAIQLLIPLNLWQQAQETARLRKWLYGYRLNPRRVLRQWLLTGFDLNQKGEKLPPADSIKGKFQRIYKGERQPITLLLPSITVVRCTEIYRQSLDRGVRTATAMNTTYLRWVELGHTQDPILELSALRIKQQAQQTYFNARQQESTINDVNQLG